MSRRTPPRGWLYWMLIGLLLLAACAGPSPDTKLAPREYNLAVDQADIFTTNDEATLDAQGLPSIIKDPDAHLGIAFMFLRDSDELVWRHSAGAGTYAVTVTARGDLYQGGPELTLTVGKKVVKKIFDKTSYQTLSFDSFALKEGTLIRARFSNDKWDGTPEKDRNLILSHVNLQPVESPEPTEPEPTEPEPSEPAEPEPVPTNTTRVISTAYKPYTGLLLNPERGFHQTQWITGGGAFTNFGSVRDQGYTLIRTHIGLDEFKGGPISQARLEQIRAGFAGVRDAGLKALPVISYTFPTDGTYGSGDAPLSVVLQHIEQLRPIFQEYKDVIALVQGGFIGPWGEWHSSSNNLHQGSALSQIYSKLLEVLPKERMLQVRYVFQLRNLPGSQVTNTSAHNQSNVARTGLKNMCFLVDNTDGGTYGNISSDKDYLAKSSQFVPVGGETCFAGTQGEPKRYECPISQSELELFHWTFMPREGEPYGRWQSQGCFNTIRDRLGYRFELQTSSIQRDVRAGSSLTTRFVIKNTGYAAPFNPRGLALVLRNQATGATYSLPILQNRSATLDPRKWYRETGDIRVAVAPVVPKNVPAGTYDVLLSLHDPEPGLANRPEYSIQLANENIWEANTGLNLLAKGLKVTQ